ncbi:rhodanese-like domain-containing protein [Candidatus Pelagibacter communis]|uniref:rhodanese-like domain-containing protein n=1 Tax=Pelagibacter ubique TaxID=198252 RepID=UPI00094DE9AF|nr:rhodanese-like domain-containing protein [Candidatus Pelagibacter ubique]
MTIKSIQTLVNDAMQEIKTISADEAYKLFENNNCNLIDVREINELENSGKVQGANHMPRGMLEVYLDPNSPVFQNGQLDKDKEFVLFCAGGVRSALAVKSLKDMGYQKISHIEGGFASIAGSKFKIV